MYTTTVHLEAGEILLEHRSSPYTSEQLLQEHAAIMDQLQDDRAWLNAKPAGREVL